MRLFSGAMTLLLAAGIAVADEAEGLFSAEVTANRLRLRAGPGEAYQDVVTVEKGTKVVVLGTHGNDADWYQVEVPTGYTAWVSGEYVERGSGGMGTVTGDRVLVRPRPSTRYHQLAGRLDKGETVRIVGEEPAAEGVWLRIEVPSRIPLYAHRQYLNKIGAPSLARAAAKSGAAPAAGEPAAHAEKPRAATEADKRFVALEGDVRAKMASAKTPADFEPLKRAVNEFDRSGLSMDTRERRVRLLSDMLEQERAIVVADLKAREDQVKETLDARLKEIDRAYKQRLAEIRAEYEKEHSPPYTAMGIVKWTPDIVGRHPSYSLEEGGKMKFFLIANQYDLQKFVGKRVGVVGIKDPESGTGHETIMIRRIEILGDR